MRWTVKLGCGCIWRVEGTPGLARPLLCGTGDHGLVMIALAERIDL